MLKSYTDYSIEQTDDGLRVDFPEGNIPNHSKHEGIKQAQRPLSLSDTTKQTIHKQIYTDLKQQSAVARFKHEIRTASSLSALSTSTILASSFLAVHFLAFLLLPLAFNITIGSDLWTAIFVLSSDHIEYIWTWITNVFAHGSFLHLFINTFVFVSFGYFVEDELDARRFFGLFLVSGIIASLAQAIVGIFFAENAIQVLGASGGIAAILGCAAILYPEMRVRLFFLIPMKMTTAVKWFIGLSTSAIIIYGFGAGQIAHTAHIVGLLSGLAYGHYYLHTETRTEDYLHP